ncbi:tudor/PWWP/MBT domain-containing protein isoform X2 [Wolffia australiana]
MFSIESKSKLVVRSRGKYSKDFGRAVEEICEAYEKVHGKESTNQQSSETIKSDDGTAVHQTELKKVDGYFQDDFPLLKHTREIHEAPESEPKDGYFRISIHEHKKLPQSSPNLERDDGESSCLHGKSLKSKSEQYGKSSSLNQNISNLREKYVSHRRSNSGSNSEDKHVGIAVGVVDQELVEPPHLSERVGVCKEKKVILCTTQEGPCDLALLSKHYPEKTMVDKRRALDVSMQSEAKRAKHVDDLDANTKSPRKVSSNSTRERKEKRGKSSPSAVKPFNNSVDMPSNKALAVPSEGIRCGMNKEFPNQKNSPVHSNQRRRTFRMDDDEDDEILRTPIHRRSNMSSSPKLRGRSFGDKLSISKFGDHSDLTPRNVEERKSANIERKHCYLSPGKQDNKRTSVKESRIITKSSSQGSEKKTDLSINAVMKTPTLPFKRSDEPDLSSHATSKMARALAFSETKGMQKSELLMDAREKNMTNTVECNTVSKELSYEERSAISFTESNGRENVTSMKHLIAVAQAKRREVQLHDHPYNGVPSLVCSPPVVRERSPSPLTEALQVPNSRFSQKVDGEYFFSPNTVPQNPHACVYVEHGEHKLDCGHEMFQEDASIGDMEATVARDALEGMIETLSRAKESIGRATRLAIECAKYGIATQVVDLLIQKLESETSHHRKVDLFFLVDSITQCSHSQKGVAGESFVPAVQNALQRLLAAAVPPGSGASENRRQCLKVLKLWLERNIFPESVLRPLMDGIKASYDGQEVHLVLRPPSRADRPIDDPIRDMEGILVDEYGSNDTFNLPSFITNHLFEEDLSSSGTPISGSIVRTASTVTYGSEGGHLLLEDAAKYNKYHLRHCLEFPTINGSLGVRSSAQRENPALIDHSFLVPLDSSHSPPPLPLSPPFSPPPLPSSPPPLSPPPLPSSPPPLSPPPLPSSPPPVTPPPPLSPPPILPPPPPLPPTKSHLERSMFPHLSFTDPTWPSSPTHQPAEKKYGGMQNGHSHDTHHSPGSLKHVECNSRPTGFSSLNELIQNSASVESQGHGQHLLSSTRSAQHHFP